MKDHRSDFRSSLRITPLVWVSACAIFQLAVGGRAFAFAFATMARTKQSTGLSRSSGYTSSTFSRDVGGCSAITSRAPPAGTAFHSAGAFELKMWGNDDNINGRDRILSCVPYMLPLLDGDHFGKYIYQRIPPLGLLDAILLGPLEAIYHSIPFLGLGLFILLSFGSRNTEISRPVRFNMQQAILIDIALIFPELFGAFGGDAFALPRFIVEPSSNFVYYAFISAIGYCIVNNLLGKKPNQIPWISDAAEMQIGPF